MVALHLIYTITVGKVINVVSYLKIEETNTKGHSYIHIQEKCKLCITENWKYRF